MNITLLEFCKECDPEMVLCLINDYTLKETTCQVKDILEHESNWYGTDIHDFSTTFSYFSCGFNARPYPTLIMHCY